MEKSFGVFVNTTDSFEDCWVPFFKLFTTYWKGFNGNIYLNTERKDFSFEGLNIIPVKNAQFIKGQPSWGKSLKTALNNISEDIVLYLQEDYFFNNLVHASFISEAYQLMKNDVTIGCIHLTDQATPGPFEDYTNPRFKIIASNAAYRISCQAALWRKDVLQKYIRSYESPWQLELIGTKRAKYMYNDTFLIVNPANYGIGKNEIIPYVFTGIIKGKWKKETQVLFYKNEIEVNFTKRGFIEDTKQITSKKNVKWFKYQLFKMISLIEIFLKKR